MTVSRVRIPLSPFALLAQLDRVFGYGPKGRGFESLTARKTMTIMSWSFFIAFLGSLSVPYKVRLIGDVLEIVVVRLILFTQKCHTSCVAFFNNFLYDECFLRER